MADIDNYSLRDLTLRTIVDTGSGLAQRVLANVSSTGVLSTIELPPHDLSTGEFIYTTALSSNFFLRKVVIHFSQDVIEDVKFYENKSNALYNTLVYQDNTSNDGGVTGEQDFAFFPLNNWQFNGVSGDQFKMVITNNGGAGIAYVTLLLEVIA